MTDCKAGSQQNLKLAPFGLAFPQHIDLTINKMEIPIVSS